MIREDYLSILLNCKKYNLIRRIFENVIELSIKAKIVSYDYNDEIIMFDRSDHNYTNFLLRLIDNYINSDFSKKPGVYFMELYLPSGSIFQFCAEDQDIYFSDDFEKEYINILKSIFSRENSLDLIIKKMSAISDHERKQIAPLVNDFDSHIKKISFPTEYQTLFNMYPEDMLSTLEEIKQGNWSNDNYEFAIYNNILVKLVADIYEKKLV